jgi:hypothetical protein
VGSGSFLLSPLPTHARNKAEIDHRPQFLFTDHCQAKLMRDVEGGV